jgi:hypothetical protein
MWGQELARALGRCEALLVSQKEDIDQLPGRDMQILRKMVTRLQFSLQDLWKETTPDVFDVGYAQIPDLLSSQLILNTGLKLRSTDLINCPKS